MVTRQTSASCRPRRAPGTPTSCGDWRPTTELWGREAYPSLDEKAAALMQSLVGNHALVDGNRRLGWLAVVVFYGLNGVQLEAPDDDVHDLVISVASGEASLAGNAESLHRWH